MQKMKNLKNPMICLFALVIFSASVLFSGCGNIKSEEFLMRSKSSDGKYVLEAYLESGGTIEKGIVKVYRDTDNSKTLIYTNKGTNVEIKWEDDKTAVINGTSLDLSKEETFDYSKE